MHCRFASKPVQKYGTIHTSVFDSQSRSFSVCSCGIPHDSISENSAMSSADCLRSTLYASHASRLNSSYHWIDPEHWEPRVFVFVSVFGFGFWV